MRRLIFWTAEHPTLTLSLFFLAVFLLLNLLAYRHAHSMTHFAPAYPRPRKPDNWRPQGEPLSFLQKVQLAVNGVAIERPAEADRPDGLYLSYEVHSYPGEAGRLAAWHIPRERPAGRVVLFHGYAASKARLLPEARAFHDLGYACFLVDFRGSGDSEGDRTSIGYHEADDVVRTLAYVRQQWPQDRLVIFGQSMGAAAVLRAMAHHAVEPDAVVLECPFDRLLSTVEARFAVAGLPRFPAAQLLVFWGGLQHGFNGFGHNPVDYARQVTCPALLLHGTHDQRVSVGQMQSIYQNLGGEKHLRFFEGLGHESYAAPRADEWKEHVARFLHNRSPLH
jgi:alpha-beta hydrolase superfamily lysophospholipase